MIEHKEANKMGDWLGLFVYIYYPATIFRLSVFTERARGRVLHPVEM